MESTEEKYKVVQNENLEKLSKITGRTSRLVLRGKPNDLPIYEIPIKYLYFNIENGRYADRMIKLRMDNLGIVIDAKQIRWRDEIKDMLLGTSKHVMKGWGDKVAAERLKEDIEKRTQIFPGLVGRDGGVLDGNRRLAVIMDLGKEYFDGVILPADVSREDKWRIEAGLQLGKPIVQDYSPVNELLKVREGLEIFKSLKREGRDPAPTKSPEELVADAIYGRDVNQIKEWISRIELMDQYLEFIHKKGRYDLIGERSERFLESVKVINAAKMQGWTPELTKKLKAWLFHQILEEKIDNWELREIYKLIGGDPSKKGKKPKQKMKAREEFVRKLPDADIVRAICKEVADLEDATINKEKNDKQSEEKRLIPHAEFRNKSILLKDEILGTAEKEKEEEEPLEKLEEARDRLDTVRDSTDLIKRSGKVRRAIEILDKIDGLTKDCIHLLK